MNPAASIVIVHHRGLARLLRTLDAAQREAAGNSSEIILVDNHSSEGALAEVARRMPAVRAVPLDRNTGFAVGCRRGAEAAAAPFVVFLNDDAVPEEGWLAALLAAIRGASADVAAIAGRMTDVSGRRNDFSGGFLTFDGHAFAADAGRPIGSFEPGRPGDERLFACGGNMLVRRDVFFDTGGFDDDYFAYLEDVDFGWRQWIFGGRILFEPRASVRHEGGATGEALGIFRRGYLIEKNSFATAYKNLDEHSFRELLPSIFAAFLSRLAAMIAERNPGSAELTRNPYEDLVSSRRSRILGRIGAIAGFPARRAGARLDDPLTIAQLQALHEIFAASEGLALRRDRVQRRRRRPDSEIFQKFPAAIVPTYPGDGRFAGEFFRSFAPRGMDLARRGLSDIFFDAP